MIPTYAVVRTDLGHCLGPFESPEAAIVVARKLTKEGTTYVPIPMSFVGMVVDVETFHGLKSQAQRADNPTTTYEPKGYL